MNLNHDPNDKNKKHDLNCAGIKCKNCEFKPDPSFELETD